MLIPVPSTPGQTFLMFPAFELFSVSCTPSKTLTPAIFAHQTSCPSCKAMPRGQRLCRWVSSSHPYCWHHPGFIWPPPVWFCLNLSWIRTWNSPLNHSPSLHHIPQQKPQQRHPEGVWTTAGDVALPSQVSHSPPCSSEHRHQSWQELGKVHFKSQHQAISSGNAASVENKDSFVQVNTFLETEIVNISWEGEKGGTEGQADLGCV